MIHRHVWSVFPDFLLRGRGRKLEAQLSGCDAGSAVTLGGSVFDLFTFVATCSHHRSALRSVSHFALIIFLQCPTTHTTFSLILASLRSSA